MHGYHNILLAHVLIVEVDTAERTVSEIQIREGWRRACAADDRSCGPDLRIFWGVADILSQKLVTNAWTTAIEAQPDAQYDGCPTLGRSGVGRLLPVVLMKFHIDERPELGGSRHRESGDGF